MRASQLLARRVRAEPQRIVESPVVELAVALPAEKALACALRAPVARMSFGVSEAPQRPARGLREQRLKPCRYPGASGRVARISLWALNLTFRTCPYDQDA